MSDGGDAMIARLWHGRTARADADAYLAFLKERAIPDYRKTPGNLAVYILHRLEGDVAHFVTLTHWASYEGIRSFAGEDIAVAKYYPEDEKYLLEFEPTVQHFEVAEGGA
jgi:hypothetical protein